MSTITDYYRYKNELLKENSGLDISQFSCVQAKIQPMSTFSDLSDLQMPLRISGRLISSGKFNDKALGEITVAPEDLKLTTIKWEGIEIFSSHEVFNKLNRGQQVSINEKLGRIIKTVWNEAEKAIDFVAEIFDFNVAFKILNGLIQFISVGFGRDIVRKDGNTFMKNILPKETSFVFDPRDSKAKFEPVLN